MHFPLPQPEFSFAGFTFPKFVFTLPRGTFEDRINRMRKPMVGPLYHKPAPENVGSAGFSLNGSDMPNLRWEWCDEVSGANIEHTGWYCDLDNSGDKIRGIVFRLPRNRGFVAGWSMGKGMASGVEPHIYKTQRDAAYAADQIAEDLAERNRDAALEALEKENDEESDDVIYH